MRCPPIHGRYKVPYQLVAYEGVLRLLPARDFRLIGGRFGYVIVGNALYDRDGHRATANGVRYRVYADGTVRALNA